MTGQTDKAFFKEQIGTTMNALYGTALRLTRNPDDAQDLVAETVTKAWAAIDSLNDRERFRSWVFCILNNTFISLYRKQKAAPGMESYYEDGGADEDEPFSLFEKLHQPFLLWWGNPEMEYVNKLLGDDINAAIDELPDAFKEAVIMIDIQGLSYEEAATCVGVPIGTIRSRIKRGRTQLQQNLWEQASEAGINLPDTTQGETP